MWKIWIVSNVIGSTEPKFTLYDTFDHFETCYHVQLVLEEEFTQGEYAFCEESK